MTNLPEIAASVTQFSAAAGLTLIPGVPEDSVVSIDPDDLDLDGFLTLAAQLGGGVLYLKQERFDTARDAEAIPNPPDDFLKHQGELGRVAAAFAVNGMAHLWESRTAWYDEWKKLDDYDDWAPQRADSDPDDQRRDWLDEEELKRRSGEVANIADTLLASPEFRAAKPGEPRRRVGERAVSEGTHRHVRQAAIEQAAARAEELTKVVYSRIIAERLDDLADELLATAAWQGASSAAGKRQAAAQFLPAHADGFSPPSTLAREELYGRAQQRAKAKPSIPA